MIHFAAKIHENLPAEAKRLWVESAERYQYRYSLYMQHLYFKSSFNYLFTIFMLSLTDSKYSNSISESNSFKFN